MDVNTADNDTYFYSVRVFLCVNLFSCSPGIPCLLYGLAATQLIRHIEVVKTTSGPVNIYFLYPEDKGSPY